MFSEGKKELEIHLENLSKLAHLSSAESVRFLYLLQPGGKIVAWSVLFMTENLYRQVKIINYDGDRTRTHHLFGKRVTH